MQNGGESCLIQLQRELERDQGHFEGGKEYIRIRSEVKPESKGWQEGRYCDAFGKASRSRRHRGKGF